MIEQAPTLSYVMSITTLCMRILKCYDDTSFKRFSCARPHFLKEIEPVNNLHSAVVFIQVNV